MSGTEIIDFWKDENFLSQVKKNWESVKWGGQNTYSKFDYNIILHFRPDKKSTIKFSGFYVKFTFLNSILFFSSGKGDKIKPPKIGVIFAGYLEQWREFYKTLKIKPLKRKFKVINSSDNLQMTSGGMQVHSPFFRVFLETISNMNLLPEELKPNCATEYQLAYSSPPPIPEPSLNSWNLI